MEKDPQNEMIPIPEGLERRLLSSIDRWRECLTKGLAGALAAVLLAVGLTARLAAPAVQPARDSFTDPLAAYQEAGKALELLVENLERGLTIIDNPTDNE